MSLLVASPHPHITEAAATDVVIVSHRMMEIAIWWKLSFDQTICPIFGELTSEEQQIAIFHLLPRNVNPLISLPLHNRYKWRWRWDITLSLINNTLDTFMLAQELRPLVLQLLQHTPESNKKIQNILRIRSNATDLSMGCSMAEKMVAPRKR